MKVDEKTGWLIAVGASIAANCQACLEHNTARAQQSGANPQEITDAIQIGKKIRQGAAAHMDRFTLSLDGFSVLAASAFECCSSKEELEDTK